MKFEEWWANIGGDILHTSEAFNQLPDAEERIRHYFATCWNTALEAVQQIDADAVTIETENNTIHLSLDLERLSVK